MELPGPLDHSFDARAMKGSDLCHRSSISSISYLWIYASLHFSTLNKINNRHRKPGSMTETFMGCRTRIKLEAERVNKSVTGVLTLAWVIAALCALQSSLHVCGVRGSRHPPERMRFLL